MLEQEGGASSREPEQARDELLVQALLQGDPDATAELFDRYAAPVQRVLTRILGYTEPERADLLHEVFMRALERLADLKRKGSLKPWLMGIAVFTAREWIRKKRQRGPLLSPEDGAAREVSDASPEAREAVRCFYALVSHFDDDERTAFILRALEGMTLNEVATACNVSVSTARRRIDRAEQRFRELLHEYPPLLERMQRGGSLS